MKKNQLMTLDVPDLSILLGLSFLVGSFVGAKLSKRSHSSFPKTEADQESETILHLTPADAKQMRRFALAMHFNSLERLQRFALTVLDWYIGNRRRGWTICAFDPDGNEAEAIRSDAYDPDPLDYNLEELRRLTKKKT